MGVSDTNIVAATLVNTNSTTNGTRTSARQVAHQDFDALVQALQAGNLSDAQQAYSGFQLAQAASTSGSSSQSTSSSATSTGTGTSNSIISDWSTLGQALQSGSLSAAQKAMSTLQQDAQSVKQSSFQTELKNAQSLYALLQSTKADSDSSTTSASTTSGSTTTGSTGSNAVQNDLASLSQSLQSGDITAAEKVLKQLQQDLQNSQQGTTQTSDASTHHHHHHHGKLADVANTLMNAANTTSSGGTSTGSTTSTSTGNTSTASTGSTSTIGPS